MKTIIYFCKLEEYKNYHYFPYSALCVAAPLVALGEDVEIFDERVDRTSYIIDILSSGNVDKVLFTVFTGYQLSQAYGASKFIKQNYPDIKIIWGGPGVEVIPDIVKASEYVDEIRIGYAETGEYPMPWQLIDVEKYVNRATRRFIYISSYSCIGNCGFCQTTPRRKLVFLPLDKVEKDIDNLMKLYLFRECILYDATIFTIPERALFLSRLMKKHNLKFICDARADEICRTPKDILDEIVSNGLVQATIGLESASPSVVERMNKGKNHLENYKKCAEIMSRYDVKMCSGVIFGTPGESPEDIKQTIEYIKEIKAINPNFYISTTFYMPLPMTAMCDEAKEYGYIEPKSLEEYAERGADMHYKYNSHQASMWIREPEEYHKIYTEFIEGNKDLFI